ncbi:hypothetical protein D3C76_1309640 [compost metagenome]
MLVLLKVGDCITAKKFISNDQVKRWRFSPEFPTIFNDFKPGIEMKVVEKSLFLDWVRVEIKSIDPPILLKITKEEFAEYFRIIKCQE